MFENTWPLMAYSVSMMITPGPNNLMLTASGVNFGYRRSLPHIAGVTLGALVMVGCIGLGLGSVFTLFPGLHTVMQWAGSAYLLLLAVKVARFDHSPNGGEVRGAQAGRPLTLMQAALFQWINPKAWLMDFSAVAAFTRGPDTALWDLCLIALVYALTIPLCISVWTCAGVRLGRLLTAPARRRTFNLVLAGLLVGSLFLIHQ